MLFVMILAIYLLLRSDDHLEPDPEPLPGDVDDVFQFVHGVAGSFVDVWHS